jgi:hypothetical protein
MSFLEGLRLRNRKRPFQKNEMRPKVKTRGRFAGQPAFSRAIKATDLLRACGMRPINMKTLQLPAK